VILTSPDEVERWMTAPADEALKLPRPLPDGSLRIVARGVKEDPAFAGPSDMNTFVSRLRSLVIEMLGDVGSGQTEKNSVRSAVGTVIADRPPPKSVQAEFPHTAPTLGA
jgi:hypothetical protein